MIYAGVDGGSTKTLAVAADEEGRVLGVGRAGPSNYHVVGLDGAVENINASLGEASPGGVDVAAVGLAGMDTEYDFQLFEREAAPRIAARQVLVRHDAEIALVGATAGGPGIIVIAGTGSAAGGRNREGRYLRCGGWGYILGDEGSAYWLGRNALTAVLRASDGRGPETMLTGLVLGELGLSRPDEIVRRVYVEGMTVKEIAGLAPLVVRAAEAGDGVARGLVEEAARLLAEHVWALAGRLGLGVEEPVDVAPVGGVFRAGPTVLEPFKRYVAERVKARIIEPRFPPAVGALLIAYMEGGVEVTPGLLKRLESTAAGFGLKP